MKNDTKIKMGLATAIRLLVCLQLIFLPLFANSADIDVVSEEDWCRTVNYLSGIVPGPNQVPKDEKWFQSWVDPSCCEETLDMGEIDCRDYVYESQGLINSVSLISKVIPDTVSAGLAKYDKEAGVVTYSDNLLILKIEGKELSKAASLQVNNLGIDGHPGIEFRQIQVNGLGTILQAQMVIKPTAKEGNNVITLTTTSGQFVNFNLNVTINGNQYLNRRFANTTIKFYGLWNDVGRVMRWADDLQAGWEFMNQGAYKPLNISLSMFEQGYWMETAQFKYCDIGSNNSGFGIGGCAYRKSPYVYLSERSQQSRETLKEVIVHESAHKLHHFYNDVYTGRVVVSVIAGFQSKWKNAVGNLEACTYLPVANGNWTNDNDPYMPRCGFVKAYGATNLKTYAEDVATFTEIMIDKPEVLSNGHGPTDSRYRQKIDILKSYDFIP